MSIEGFSEYKRREFCNDVSCPVQMQLNAKDSNSEEYEHIRQKCATSCCYTTWQFHHWLIEKGYIMLVSLKSQDKTSLTASIDKDVLQWIDKQIQQGKYNSRSQLIESAITQYRKEMEQAAAVRKLKVKKT